MASKDQFLTSEDKKSVMNSSEDQYQNLNLKQDNQSLDRDTVTTEVMQLKTAIELSNVSDEPTVSTTQASSDSSGENGTRAKYCQLQSGPYYEEHKCLREPKFAVSYDKKYFSKTVNGLFWSPVSVPDFKQSSPQLTALLEKTNEMQTLIKKKEYLSSGTYGSVSLCKIKGLKSMFVFKTLKRIRENADEIDAELNVYSQINSPLFPKLFYAGIYKKTFCIISEFASGGDLDQNKHRIGVADVRFIAYELFLAIRCLHEIKVSHGDLKGNNVALTADGHIKLLDFGMSRNISTPTVLPTTPFMAPEVRARRPAGASADFYSYGCILIGLMQKDVDAYDLNKPSGDPVADDFIKTCFIKNEKIRMNRVIEHQYLKMSNPRPTYIPGPLKIQKRQPPAEETEHPEKTFCISDESLDTILKNSLIRFPSSKNYYNCFFNSIL